MDKIPMQTLQIYRKSEKIPARDQIKIMTEKLEEIKKNHSTLPKPAPIIPPDEPQVKTIEWQNTITKIDTDLVYWTKDYRKFIDELCELDRTIPKTYHNLNESDEKAQENVDKIIKVDDIREQILNEFKEVCLKYEENDEKSKRRIKQLESELEILQLRTEELEYRLSRKMKS